jgi:F-type H+-transporting ATPase subunit gamma
VLTSDRGLCGAFNGNIIKFSERFYRDNKEKYEEIHFIFIGRKGAEHFKRRNVQGVETITNLVNDIKYTLAAALADKIMNEYTSGSYDEVILVYNEFKTAMNQKVVAEKILPIQPLAEAETVHAENEDIVESKDFALAMNYIFEPSADQILTQLLPKHFAIQVYRAMLESIAGEHGARMSAMDSATRNAGQMIKKLTLTYNKLRQAAITRELVEIVSGAEALK